MRMWLHKRVTYSWTDFALLHSHICTSTALGTSACSWNKSTVTSSFFLNDPFNTAGFWCQVLTLCTSWVSGYLHQVSTEPMALLIWQYPPSHLDGKHAVLLKEIQTTIIKYYYLATYSQGPHSGLHANTACWTLSAGQETLGSLTAFNPCVLSNLHSSTTCCYKKIQHTQRKCGTAL